MKAMKKIVKVLLISLMILMTFTVNTIADDDYGTIYQTHFGTRVVADSINNVMVYVLPLDDTDPLVIGLKDKAYTTSNHYCVGYYPTDKRLPWTNNAYPEDKVGITDVNEIMVLLGNTPFKRDEIRTKTIYNTSFDLNRVTFTKLAFGNGAATKIGEEIFGTSVAVWHLDGVADKYIYSIKNGEEL